MGKRLCSLCKTRPAEVPDRNTTSMSPRICRECHAARLRDDLAHVLRVYVRRKYRDA